MSYSRLLILVSDRYMIRTQFSFLIWCSLFYVNHGKKFKSCVCIQTIPKQTNIGMTAICQLEKSFFFLKSLSCRMFKWHLLFSKSLAHFFLDGGLLTPAGAMLQEREANWTENQEIEGPIYLFPLDSQSIVFNSLGFIIKSYLDKSLRICDFSLSVIMQGDSRYQYCQGFLFFFLSLFQMNIFISLQLFRDKNWSF